MISILNGDAVSVLKTLPGNSVDCVLTSPPYFGLRDYKTTGQIGLESSFHVYLSRLLEVFEQVHRVLKPSGVMWINQGNSFVNDGGAGWQGKHGGRAGRRHTQSRLVAKEKSLGLEEKNLIGQPWRLAFALQERGWILRQECIWYKPTAMPESAKDRPTSSHEQVFLFSKSPQYFYDYYNVMEMATGNAHATVAGGGDVVAMRSLRSVWRIPSQPFADEWCTACKSLYNSSEKRRLDRVTLPSGKPGPPICHCGRSDAWVAHFATFPRSLAERCIKAGSSEHGCCAWCGAPFRRIVKHPKVGDWNPDPENKRLNIHRNSTAKFRPQVKDLSHAGKRRLHKADGLAELTKVYRENGNVHPHGWRNVELPRPEHVGWKKSCKCRFEDVPVPAVVCDPFAGACTTSDGGRAARPTRDRDRTEPGLLRDERSATAEGKGPKVTLPCSKCGQKCEIPDEELEKISREFFGTPNSVICAPCVRMDALERRIEKLESICRDLICRNIP